MYPSEALIKFLAKEKNAIMDIEYTPVPEWRIRIRLPNYGYDVAAETLEQALFETVRKNYPSFTNLELSNLPFLEKRFYELALSYTKMTKQTMYNIQLSYNWTTHRWVLILIFGIPCLMVSDIKLDKVFERFNTYLICETTKLAGSSTTPKGQVLIQKFDSLDGELLEEISLTRFVDLYPRLSENHEHDFVERILNGETLYSISYHFKKK